MLRPLFFLALAFGVTTAARAQDPEASLEKAKKAYSENSDKARATLLEAFATASKTATASGNLDVVKALQVEKEAFEAGGKLPTSARMKTAVVTHQLSIKQATTTLEKAYEQGIKELTKSGKLAAAEAAQAELKEFRSKGGASPRPADVATRDDLHRYLAETVWALEDDLKLRQNGATENKGWESRGLVVTWEAVDRRTIVLFIAKGRDNNRIATFTFSEDLTECRAFMFDGSRKASIKRKP